MEKRARFVMSAEKRTNKIIRAIRTLGHCSNKSIYEYRDRDVEKIFNAINKELIASKRRFRHNGTQSGPDFRLDPDD